MKHNKAILLTTTILVLAMLFGCASNTEEVAALDKQVKSMKSQGDKFQKMAVQKIGALEKDVKALKSNQAKMAKQIPAIVNQIKVLKKAIGQAGQGVTPEMEAQLNDILSNLEALEADLANVKEAGLPAVEEEPVEELEPIEIIRGSDQELVLRDYGRPTERYTIDGKNHVWLYDGGVVVFDQSGKLMSLKFE